MATDLHRPTSPRARRRTVKAPLAVRVDGLTRAYDGRPVLDGLRLDIRPGEVVALLGRAGSGKSALLRVLAGLDRDIEGTVLVPRRKAVALHAPQLPPWKRVWRCVLLGLPGKPDRARAERALDAVGLGHRTNARAKALSPDEVQLVWLAQALLREPELLLLDEPFGTPSGEVWRRPGVTVLLATRDAEAAERLADRVVVIDGGVIVHERPRRTEPRSSREDPRTPPG
ncbi:aliphatic sulfonates import ATP-binding protein SsuB [Streptomyces sp. NBRC 14336]|uniref:ATP-binding cassette domain-containing protein n=1 Tax=Streptomyces sp. NBRC 14336 TaxID=3030992 RepID=UPI0024A109D0|nr:ATP-binding cassette domain-containing protein [Streptomyces sp. NBRC 14336]GLW47052.1 aliphatic sulfonates import ATP-binding protein SsuB [Streptomyces sp. NBRC 14336]